jgi:hypothetical protein
LCVASSSYSKCLVLKVSVNEINIDEIYGKKNESLYTYSPYSYGGNEIFTVELLCEVGKNDCNDGVFFFL